MDGQCIEERARTGPVRPPRPSQSLDYIRPSPRATPRNSADLPAMMRKRISTKNVRSTSQLQNQLSPGLSPSFRYSGAGSTTASERKGSFKNVVRKLFGRRLKYGGSSPEISRPNPSGHGYHRSVSRNKRHNEASELIVARTLVNLYEHKHYWPRELRGRIHRHLYRPEFFPHLPRFANHLR